MSQLLPVTAKKINLDKMAKEVLTVVLRNKGKVDSLFVAERFGKRHDNVLRDIRDIIEQDQKMGIWLLNFEERDYVDDRGKTQIKFEMNEPGFLELTLGYSGERAWFQRKVISHAFVKLRDKEIARHSVKHINRSPARQELASQFVSFTDAVELFLEHVRKQNPSSGTLRHGYKYFTEWVHMTIGLKPRQPEGFRNTLSDVYLKGLTYGEAVMRDFLLSLLDLEIDYQKIKQQFKRMCEKLGEQFMKSLPPPTELSLTSP